MVAGASSLAMCAEGRWVRQARVLSSEQWKLPAAQDGSASLCWVGIAFQSFSHP